MRKTLAVCVATVGGGFVAGTLGLLAHESFPVFHWELAGLALILFSALGGAITALAVGSGRAGTGILVGALFAGLLFACASMADRHPSELTVWGAVVVLTAAVIAGGVAGGVASLIRSQTGKPVAA
jgi:hypothetical protein